MSLKLLKDTSEILDYNNQCFPIYIRKSDLSHFPNKQALCHWHQDIELLLALEGSINYNVNGQSFLVNQGHAIFINSRQMHFGYSDHDQNCTYICLVFNPSLLFAHELIQENYVNPLLESDVNQLLIQTDSLYGTKIIQLIKDLLDLYHLNTSTIEMQVLALLYQIWDNLYQLIQPLSIQKEQQNDLDLKWLKQMLSYIYNHYSTKVSLADIAKSGNMSKSKCCSIFKHYLNNTPIGYLNTFRLDKSMSLLRHSSLNISDIAYTCGFSNPSYFSEIFLKYKGLTPSDYRSS